MTPGDVRLDHTFWGRFFARFSILSVFLGARRRKPVEDRTVCPECGGTRESWTCPICSEKIPAYLETCPFCGDVAGREA
jgi:hypothetical protein